MQLIARLRRFVLRWKWAVEYEKSLNRRAKVENELIECAVGKRELPDKAKCMEWAKRLGVPDEWGAKR